jgi:hypothetical protein
MDLSTLTGAPREVDLAGVRYKVPALKMRDWGLIQAWIKDNVPSPMASIRSEDLSGLSPADKATLMREAIAAQRAWPPRVGTRAWFEAIDHPARPLPDGSEAPTGTAVLLHTVLRAGQPFTLAEAIELDARATAADTMAAVLAAMGVDDDAPKPEGAEGATTPGP